MMTPARLHVETDPPLADPPGFAGPTAVLVYFLSLAFSTRYGSIHPLSQLVLLLRGEYKINMTPLTTFADREVEVDDDQAELDRVWQEAAPLAATLDAVMDALASGDGRIATLTADTPDLAARLADLRAIAHHAARHDARVRLSYDL